MRKIEIITRIKKAEDFIMSNMPELKIGVVAVSRDCFRRVFP